LQHDEVGGGIRTTQEHCDAWHESTVDFGVDTVELGPFLARLHVEGAISRPSAALSAAIAVLDEDLHHASRRDDDDPLLALLVVVDLLRS
jgi:hypothetical protein